jgi:L-fucose isomerase-like protein
MRRLHKTAGAATTNNKTKVREKVLLFGQCQQGFLDQNQITSDFETIYLKLRVRIKQVARKDLIARYNGLNEQESTKAKTLTEELIAGTKQRGRARPGAPDIFKGVRFYMAVRSIMAERRADAANIVCGQFRAQGMPTPCVALTFLLDRGIPAVCQGDHNALLTMILFKRSIGQIGFMGNPSAWHKKLVLTHCVLPRTMKGQASPQPYYLGDHHGRRPGPTIHTDLLPGEPVTVARLTRNLDRLMVTEGRVTGSFDRQGACRNTLVIRIRDLPKVATFVTGSQCHLVAVCGHHGHELSTEATKVGIRVIAV